MKEIKYICNVCSEKFTPNQAHSDALIFGCYFSDLHKFKIVKLPAETDRHICKQCIEQVKMSNEVTY